MVRFIDNFSKGERGSTSAECFLAQGYAVVFLYRSGSTFPFSSSIKKAARTRSFDDKFLSKITINGMIFRKCFRYVVVTSSLVNCMLRV